MKKSSAERITVPQGGDLIDDLAAMILADKHSSGSAAPRDFSSSAVIFPNRRPLYYLVDRLRAEVKSPFAPPVLLSINDLADRAAVNLLPGAAPASYLDRIFALFRAAGSSGVKIFPRDFGEFAAWGRRLLETVDEIDMAALDLSRVKSMSAEGMPQNLAEVVDRLPSIRDAYAAELSRLGLMTRPMAFAASSRGLDVSKHFPRVDVFYVCGFSDLTVLETRLLARLSSGGARVVEVSYEPPSSWNSSGVKLYRAFDTHSQIKKVAEILSRGFDARSTAVIIPRAEALVPLLTEALGRFDAEYNVSLGYPLSRSGINSFFDLVIRVQETRSSEGGYLVAEYRRLMSHPYVRAMFFDGESPEQTHAAVSSASKKSRIKTHHASLSDIEAAAPASRRESLRRAHAALAAPFERASTPGEISGGFLRLLDIFAATSASRAYPFASEFFVGYERLLEGVSRSAAASEKMSRASLYDVLRSVVGAATVPFPGVPLKGLQLLGMLEARNLKFEKIIVLDVNEGVLPGVSRFDSLLPAPLKKSLGLPTYRDREKTIRKNFMTLVNSAREAHLVYREGGRESRSRYVEEIIWERERAGAVAVGQKDIVEAVSVNASASPPPKNSVPKSEKCLSILDSMTFSPSSIDRYMRCPSAFYFASVLRLRETQDFSGELEAAGIGEFAHEVLREFFGMFPDKKSLGSPSAKETLDRIIDEKAAEHLGPSRGEAYLVREVARHRLNQAIKSESRRDEDFKIIAAEEKVAGDLIVGSAGRKVKIGGRIDRVDSRGAETWLIDYKTGAYAVPSKKLSSPLESRKEMKKLIRSFQLPLYSWLYSKAKNVAPPRAAYYSLKDIKEDEVFDKSEPSEALEKIFLPSLKNLLAEIHDPAAPFAADDDDEAYCQYCDFAGMCGR
ncbi:MAG: hypothetical protein CVU77_08350 [Elusimicrobia bacterium HGW-Elusimicrobia-1]|jgi:RecB family exonuclease|nr:MAG: hypothetical protein CVU77_08350 [Elusimicrobia bacterium HGW-Elusimicrobia-1]